MKKLRILPLLLAAIMMFPALSLAADNTVLITGANRGIGFEFVRQYTERGWQVIATCRNPDSAAELNDWADQHDNVVVERLDLTDHAGIDALAAKYEGRPVDVLLNNAGLMRGPGRGQMVGTIDYDEFELFYRINVQGPLKVSEAFYKNVKASEYKTMAALTTGKGERGIPVPGFSLYKTSKAAMDAMQKEVALRWKRQGIKVVTLLPGRVLTRGEDPARNPNAVAVGDSVGGMISLLDDLSMEQTGHTYQWDGEFIE